MADDTDTTDDGSSSDASAPTGTDPQFENAAAATITQLRSLWESAVTANGATDSNLASQISSGPSSFFGFFDNTGRLSILKNLQTDGQLIDRLSTTLKTWAENGQQDDGSPYDWGKWAAQADVIGSDMKANFNLAWDASTLGPIVNAVGATAHDVAVAVDQVENAAVSAFTSPWLYIGLAVAGAVLLFPSLLGRAAKAAGEAVKEAV